MVGQNTHPTRDTVVDAACSDVTDGIDGIDGIDRALEGVDLGGRLLVEVAAGVGHGGGHFLGWRGRSVVADGQPKMDRIALAKKKSRTLTYAITTRTKAITTVV